MPVQDLRLVNQATVTLHPTVPNPYSLLSLLPLRTKVYTCLDLQDAFCICLTPVSQRIFALNGKIQSGATNNSSSGLPHKGLRTPQPSLGKPWLLTWTHSIWKSMDFGSYNTGMTCWLLETKEKCWKGTNALLQLLMEAGYWKSKKAQIYRGGKVSGACFKEELKVPDPNWVLYTDGTSLIKQGQRLSD